jgi:hypothetical protein
MNKSFESNLTTDEATTSHNISLNECADDESNDNNQSRKRSFQDTLVSCLSEIAKNKEKFTNRTFKKKKMTRMMPVYMEGSNPTQILNEIYPGLTFRYDVDVSTPSEIKFICQVEIKHEILNDDEQQMESSSSNFNIFDFKGYGSSKKESKRQCCYKALSVLFADSYKLPESLLIENETNRSNLIEKRINELNKRINKLFNHDAVKNKTSFQLLHELSSKISETAKCVSNSDENIDNKFSYQIENLENESLVQLSSNSSENFVIAFGMFGFSLVILIILNYKFLNVLFDLGKNKKDAKNQAAKLALKQFFNIDLDTLTASN